MALGLYTLTCPWFTHSCQAMKLSLEFPTDYGNYLKFFSPVISTLIKYILRGFRIVLLDFCLIRTPSFRSSPETELLASWHLTQPVDFMCGMRIVWLWQTLFKYFSFNVPNNVDFKEALLLRINSFGRIMGKSFLFYIPLNAWIFLEAWKKMTFARLVMSWFHCL